MSSSRRKSLPKVQIITVVDAVLSEVGKTIGGQDDYSSRKVRETVQDCRQLLHSPSIFLVSGRMKAGKSTLINALVRQRIAQTSILECTDAITVYANGSPERIEDVLLPQKAEEELSRWRSGKVHRRSVAKVHYIPSTGLARATYIDTPGLGTVDDANREAIDDLKKLARGSWSRLNAGIDGIIYVFDSALREDENEHLRSLGFSPLVSVGVLSRADDYGAGAFGKSDQIAEARQRADELEAEYSSAFSTVVAASPLLAESVETGAISEQLATELGALQPMDQEILMHELETDSPAEIDIDTRERLLRILGAHGVMRGREIAAEGAVPLRNFLRRTSGISTLTEKLDTNAHFFVALGRAGQVKEKLELLAFAVEEPRILDFWDQLAPASIRLPVELYSLLKQAPGVRGNPDSRVLAERTLELSAQCLAAHGDGETLNTKLWTEIEFDASEKLLHLVSPLEEKILNTVRSLVREFASE